MGLDCSYANKFDIKYMKNMVMSDELKQEGDEKMQETYMAGRLDVTIVKDYGACSTIKDKESMPECHE